MPKLETLERKFREAHEAYADDRSDENHDKYREAKLAFTQARVEQRQAEQDDPDHPRGKSLVTVEDEGEGE